MNARVVQSIENCENVADYFSKIQTVSQLKERPPGS